MKRHVALVGFMASGKSTIGRKLARKLGCAFFDTDDLVVHEHGEVAAIFSNEGEAAFRRYERAAISGVLESDVAGVVALGGGALTIEANRELLRNRAYRIFIKASPEQIMARLKRTRQTRPLLAGNLSLTAIKELYDRRMPLYASAEHIVEADRLSGREVIDDIITWLRMEKIELGALGR
jgi:shikimate kinase